MGDADRRPAIGNASQTDDTTYASIEASPSYQDTDNTVQLDRLTRFSYSSNMMAMGDPFNVDVPDPTGKYKDKLLPGWTVRFYMQNAMVQNGVKTLKVDGLITQREVEVGPQGTVIKITGADLGWHLINNDAPLWMNLRGVSLEKLALSCIFPQSFFPKASDPGWGFKDTILTSNEQNRSIKRAVSMTAAEYYSVINAAKANGVIYMQSQPGQKIADLLITSARRMGLLVGVTADRHIMFFLPNYTQTPDFTLNLYPMDNPLHARNNVQAPARRTDSIETLFTDVTVVCTNPVFAVVPAGNVKTFSPQFDKFYGRANAADWPKGSPTLPFHRKVNISDGEITERPRRKALWHQRRGLYDALTVTLSVRGHQQAGMWWEADTMCRVNAPVLGIEETMHIQAVNCERDMTGGDTTAVTLKRQGLLDEVPLSAKT